MAEHNMGMYWHWKCAQQYSQNEISIELNARDEFISHKLINDPALNYTIYDIWQFQCLCNGVDFGSIFARRHESKKKKSLKIDGDAIYLFMFFVFFSRWNLIESTLFCSDLVLLLLDQPILRNNKQAMRLRLQQQLRHIMHKERATTRPPTKRRPHRAPMQVSIWMDIWGKHTQQLTIFFSFFDQSPYFMNNLQISCVWSGSGYVHLILFRFLIFFSCNICSFGCCFFFFFSLV